MMRSPTQEWTGVLTIGLTPMPVMAKLVGTLMLLTTATPVAPGIAAPTLALPQNRAFAVAASARATTAEPKRFLMVSSLSSYSLARLGYRYCVDADEGVSSL